MQNNNSNKKIIEYVKGSLDPVESHKLEEKMSVSDFENDALEGLMHVKDKQQLENIIKDLDVHLHKSLQRSKKRKKDSIQPMLFVVISLITILLTVFMAFYIYKLLNG